MIRRAIIKFFVSGFYFSYSPIVPGTTGTIPAWLIAYFIVGGSSIAIIVAAVALTIFSIYLSNSAEKIYGHDDKKIVIDEWAGMFVALILIPYSLINFIVAFVLFRAFDAAKIFPAGIAERLPGGWGVTADDTVAAIQANLLTHLMVYILNR
jgi:phosphatidylglycerophosphatase A